MRCDTHDFSLTGPVCPYCEEAQDYPQVRKFGTGATRDTEDGKYDLEGFLSPLVIESYGAYMHKHRVQADGSLRASDNWAKGIPLAAYAKSMWRHFFHAWKIHRGYKAFDEKGIPVTMQDALNGVLFNAMGYLHEVLKSNPEQERRT